MPNTDISGHKFKDIEIIRMKLTTESTYVFFAYGLKDNELKKNGSMAIELKDDFDRAGYVWKSDELAVVRLYNSKTKKEFFAEMTGDWLGGGSNIILGVVDWKQSEYIK